LYQLYKVYLVIIKPVTNGVFWIQCDYLLKKYYIFSNNSVSDAVQGLRSMLCGFMVTLKGR